MNLFEEAIRFAVVAHTGMQRRRESTPYILHPLEAATIAGTITSDEQVLAAAVLHDTVEDTDVTLEDIIERFGPRVGMLVAFETEDKRPDLPAVDTWRIRKEESLRRLAEAVDPGVAVLWMGDKLSNMRAFYRAWRIKGNAIWKDFNQKDPAQQAWYYRSIAELLRSLKSYEAWQEYNQLVNTVFEGVE